MNGQQPNKVMIKVGHIVILVDPVLLEESGRKHHDELAMYTHVSPNSDGAAVEAS